MVCSAEFTPRMVILSLLPTTEQNYCQLVFSSYRLCSILTVSAFSVLWERLLSSRVPAFLPVLIKPHDRIFINIPLIIKLWCCVCFNGKEKYWLERKVNSIDMKKVHRTLHALKREKKPFKRKLRTVVYLKRT